MAPDTYSYVSSAERKSVKLLPKYKCRICEKFKHPASYSKKELNSYTNAIANRIPVTAITARLRCRECAGNQVNELQCEGPCGIWKDLESFSKNQRGGGAHWCMECVLWKESQEPGVLTRAAPNQELDVDEVNTNYGDDTDPEGDADEDDGRSMVLPYRASHQYPAPSNGGFSKQKSHVPSSITHSQNIENLSIIVDGQSTISNPFENQDTASTISGWTPGDARRRVIGSTFNAYDPSGRLHVQNRPASTTGQTPSASEISQTAPVVPQGGGNWAKVPAHRTPPSRPIAPRRLVDTQLPVNYDSDGSHDSV
ncbi:Stc1 domain-containing protein [Xylogone sp. PMI_703]|nr:Stc1 domain-containing protein [Xylogone sp. PMI_703]